MAMRTLLKKALKKLNKTFILNIILYIKLKIYKIKIITININESITENNESNYIKTL